jgi:amino acid transporter
VAVVSAFLVILGLVNIGSTTAFNAILSLAVFGLHISYLLPVGFMLWRRLCTPEVLSYGPWRLKGFGVIANTISVVYLCFTCIFMLFPSYQPVTAMNMNYASLIFGAVLIFSLIYWAWKGRKVYKGPIMENSL